MFRTVILLPHCTCNDVILKAAGQLFTVDVVSPLMWMDRRRSEFWTRWPRSLLCWQILSVHHQGHIAFPDCAGEPERSVQESFQHQLPRHTDV